MTQDRDRFARARRTPAVHAPDAFAGADVFAPPQPQASEHVRRLADQPFDPSAIMASIGEAAYEWSIDSDLLAWGPNATQVLMVGSLASISSGRNYAKLLAVDATTSRFDAVMRSSVRDEGVGVPFQVQYALHPTGAEGKTLWIEDVGRWFAGADGRPARAHGVVRVINERHDHEQRLTYLSRFDGLTGEMNRFHMTEVLENALKLAVSQRNSCGFMLVAVDNVARMNEAYGFDVADEAIGAVAKRLRSKMRGGDQLGRFSGNKFGIILNNCTFEDMEKAAERLCAGVRDDVIRTGLGPVAATVTVGGVTGPRHAANVAELLARAQEALDRAKAKRPGWYHIYRPNLDREVLRRENVRAADEIVTALNERRILLAFEPIVSAATRQTAFYECLMRVRRADGQLMTASSVIPVAERLGLVRLLDHRVLELLIGEMAAVPKLNASVNVSPASIVDPDWWSTLCALLRANAGIAERLIVEITETAMIHDLDDTRGFVSRVKDLGCRIAIDDFGSGYTSFRNLRKLGVDILKIDGAFVQNIMHGGDDRVFVQALVDLARRLRLTTVAEWVQDEAAAALLTEWGCDYLQGVAIGLASVERPWGDAAPADRRKSTR